MAVRKRNKEGGTYKFVWERYEEERKRKKRGGGRRDMRLSRSTVYKNYSISGDRAAEAAGPNWPVSNRKGAI